MPAGVLHSATEAHSAISTILTGLTDRSAIGFIASGLVLATFGMKDMINLRIVAICSNVAFIVYGFELGLPPILILHVMLLPLNGWRLMGVLKQRSATRVSGFRYVPTPRLYRGLKFLNRSGVKHSGPADIRRKDKSSANL